jgi:hypothetical protein
LIDGVGVGHGKLKKEGAYCRTCASGFNDFVGLLTALHLEWWLVGARGTGSQSAVQREAGGPGQHGQPNLRCPRNGK